MVLGPAVNRADRYVECVRPGKRIWTGGVSTEGPVNEKREKSKADARAERLAQALRANLRRRKDQSRGQRAETGADKAPAQGKNPKDADS